MVERRLITVSGFKNKKIVVTGGRGFLGSHFVEKLNTEGYKNIFVPEKKDYDLTNINAVKKLYEDSKPHIVVHLAAKAGGIGANAQKPGEFFYDNLIMGAQMIEKGRKYGVEKFIAIGSICSYPKYTPVPFREENLWNGYPEETNAAYGLAKKMLIVQGEAYRKEYGLNVIALMPANLYGPGDNFDLETSHVIPALIRKCLEGVKNRQKEITLWGTGEPTREFLYVKDCAEAIFLALLEYNKPEPVNIGTGAEISIRDLADLIAEFTGFKGRFIWDKTKPDGQPRRMLDTTRAKKEFGFVAKTTLRKGLKKTIEWYKTTVFDP